MLLLDVSISTAAQRGLLDAVVQAARDVVVVVPSGDTVTIAACEAAGGVRAADAATAAAATTARERLQTWLFSPAAPPASDLDDTVRLFSAPGEGREAVEIARRVLQEAHAGVPFDQMAVLLRAPQTYVGLLEHAFARAGVPAWFERGTRRPDPAGRAFLALLACAHEGLSARRFAEYLSLGQVPVERLASAGLGPGPGLAPATSGAASAGAGALSADDIADALISPEIAWKIPRRSTRRRTLPNATAIASSAAR